MLYYLIPGIILIISLIVVIVISVRKFPQLKTLDLEAMKTHQQKEVKFSIIEERLQRKLEELKSKMGAKTAPLWDSIKDKFKKLYQRILRLEKKYKEESEQKKPQTQEEKEVGRQKVNLLITEAQELEEKKDFHEAEKKYIEALSLDQQNIEAYCGLANVYSDLKDDAHALETLQFAQKIDPENEMIWRNLGLLYRNLDDPKEALKCFKEAVKIEEHSPKNLDLLLEQSLLNKDRYEAKQALQKLKEANPENHKLAEYEEQIKEL